MNKKSNKKVKSKKFSKSKNQEIINNIILKNKEKLFRSSLKEINVENFSLKNRAENTIFYLRKKPRTKSEDSKDSELLCKKDKDFGEWKKDISKNDEPALTTKDLIDSKRYDELHSKIDKLIGYDSQSKSESEKESIGKSDIKFDTEKRSSDIKDVISEDKKDIEKSPSADQLPGFKEISEKKIPESDAVHSISDDIKKGETRDVLVDKNVGEKEVKDDKKEVEFGKKESGILNKRFISKKKKSADVGVVGLEKEGEELEEGVVSPLFPTDSIPLGEDVDEDEAKYLDERIKVYSDKQKQINKSDQVAFHSDKLQKDHDTDKSMNVSEDLAPEKKIKKEDVVPTDVNSLDKEKAQKRFYVDSENREVKKKKSLGKWKKDISKIDEPALTTKDLIHSKRFDDIVSEIDKIIGLDSKSKSEREKESISKSDIKFDTEKKSFEIKEVISEDKKDIEKSPSADQLSGFKEISETKIPVSDAFPSISDEVKEDIVKDVLIDKAASKKEIKGSKKEIKAKKKGVEFGKKDSGVFGKGLFFKKRKSADVGVVDLEKEGGDFEEGVVSPLFPADGIPLSDVADEDKVKDVLAEREADEKEIEVKKKEIKARKKEVKFGKRLFFKKRKSADVGIVDLEKEGGDSKESMITPMFRVDNIPLDDDFNKDKAKNLDEKIKIISENDKSIEEDNQVSSEDDILVKDHIKDKSKKATEDLKQDKKTNDINIVIPVESSHFNENNVKHEHVFFDEEESSSKGWSPRVLITEKNIVISQTLPQQEIEHDAMKDVGYLELSNDLLKNGSIKLSDLGFSENKWEEMDFYALNKPFAYVEILRDKDSLDKCYFLVEIALTKEEEKTLAFILDTMSSLSFNTVEMEEKGYNEYLLEKLDQIIQEYNIILSEESRKKIFYYIGKSSIGLGKIDPLMKDPNIEDISCDGAGVPIFLYHRKFGSLKSNVHFNDEDELSSFVHRLAQKSGKHISIAEPMLDATMPDGSRIQMTLSDEITAKGSTFTIRKFRADPFSPPDLIEFNTMSSEMVAYMWVAVENGVNTLFAGGTASGKTTALNALSLFIPRESKIVSIEETREINLPHPNWIPGVARSGFGEVVAGKMIGEIDLYDLMKAALRQRPEYILVGEIRGREAYVLFQAMATGHATYSTVHADSAQSLIHRLEGKPVNIPRVMLQSLDIVCLHVITRVKNMRARRCKQIIEIIDIDPTTKEILTNEVFRWDPVEDSYIYSGKSYVLERVRAEKDLNREEMTQEIKNRRKILEWMNTNNIRGFIEVAKIVALYSENSEEMLEKIEKDVKK